MSQSTAPANRRLGEFLEEHAAERLGQAHRVSANWYDIETAAGEKVESKGCQLVISDGQYTRPGRFWIGREHHERLLEAGGLYVLMVHDEGQLVHYEEVPATEMDELIQGWTNVGTVSRSGAEQATQVPHTRVIDELEVEQDA